MRKETFSKKNILRHPQTINLLFQNSLKINGKIIFLAYILKEIKNFASKQFLFVVPKKNFPNATARNKIKRRLKEAIRLNHFKLVPPSNMTIEILVYYKSKEMKSFNEIQNEIVLLLKNLQEKKE